MKYLLVILFLLSSAVLSAQEEEKNYTENSFQGSRFVNEQSANITEKGKLLMFIQHRFGEIDGGLYQLFGLDQATLRLGFEYGFGENFNLGFGRSTYMKTYDVYGKYRLARQSDSFPLTLAVTAGGSLPTIRDIFPEEYNNFSDKVSGYVQLHIAKTLGSVGVQVSPGYLSTGYLLPENESFSVFTLGMAGSVRISKKVSANIEYLPHFNDELDATKPLSLGVDVETGGHLFQLILSNSQQFITQNLYTASRGDWAEGTLFFGFNLIREFRIKYY
jgi:hypothetical protein